MVKVRVERLETSQGVSRVDTQGTEVPGRDHSTCKALKQAHARHVHETARRPGWMPGAAGRGSGEGTDVAGAAS